MEELKIGDVLFTQLFVNGYPYPMLYKVVQVRKDHYLAEPFVEDSYGKAMVSKVTLNELSVRFHKSKKRKFVRVEAEKVTDKIIGFMKNEWNFAQRASDINKGIEKANKAIHEIRDTLLKVERIQKIEIETFNY